MKHSNSNTPAINNTNLKKMASLSLISMALLMAGCSSSDDDEPNVVEDVVEDEVTSTPYGPFSTGTSSAPVFAYFDLDTGTVLELTEDQASTNEDWDIAFKRTNIYLNNNGTTPVGMYFTGNNSEYYDADGAAIVDTFVNASAEAELADYEAVSLADVPADEEFVSDVTERILDGFYNYDTTTHAVTAKDDSFYIVQSDGVFSKLRVTNLTQSGFGMSDVTLSFGVQASGETEFSTEQDLTLDLAMLCASESAVYINFATAMEVTSTEDYDISIPCADGIGSYQLDLAETSTAIQDFTNSFTGVAVEAASHYGFQPNEYTVNAFKTKNWYAYNLQGGHQLWSQYGVYIIKTATQNYKMQITSYYDAEGNSGNYSFVADPLTE